MEGGEKTRRFNNGRKLYPNVLKANHEEKKSVEVQKS